MEYTIRQEIRDERNDVFSILTTEKQLNEAKTEIIEVEVEVKKDVTREMLLKEVQEQQKIIEDAQTKINDLTEMITLIDNFSADLL